MARWAFSLGIIALLLLAAGDRWQAVREAISPALVGALVPAVALNLVANLILAGNWGRLLGVVGHPLDPRRVRDIWIRGQLARYAFGSAQLLTRPALARQAGVPLRAGVLSTVVEVVWQTGITATAALVLVPAWISSTPNGWLVVTAAAAAVAVVGILTFRPASLLGPIVRRVTRDDAPDLTVDTGRARAISSWFATNTALRTLAFLLVYAAVQPDTVTPDTIFLAAAAFVTGNLAGRLVVFAPGGLGPREAVSGILLATVSDPGVVVVLLAASRLAETAAEAMLLTATMQSRVGAPLGRGRTNR